MSLSPNTDNLATLLLSGARSALAPRPDLEVWEWAERDDRIVLSTRVTRHAGPLRFRRTPYMTGEWSPLWAYRRYQHIDNIWAAQTGKTMMIQTTIGYCVEMDPGPGMVVMPTQAMAKRRSTKHIQPFLADSMPEYLTSRKDDFQIFEYALTSCAISIAWAGSAPVLASEPIKHLWLDEEAKFDEGDDREAGSKSLAMRRLISYGEFANSFSCTTPARPQDSGWFEWAGSTQCQLYLPCHSCGHKQIAYFNDEDRGWLDPRSKDKPWSGGIKWTHGTGLDADQVAATAYYQCEACSARWNDSQLNEAVSLAEWRPRFPKARRYASHMPSWCARWVTMADVVRRWLDGYRDTQKRHDFDNSDRAIPWEQVTQKIEESAVSKHRLPGHKTGVVPTEADVLYLTADVMDDHIRYRVRAWRADTTSWGVREGALMPNLEALNGILNEQYEVGATVMSVAWGLVDARWRRDEVYQWCLSTGGRVWPSMGHDNIRELWKPKADTVVADPLKGMLLEGPVTRIDFHDGRWSDQMASRLAVNAHDPGAWHLEEDVSDEFVHQMTGMVKKDKPDSRGRSVKKWHQQHVNHGWDVEKLQLVAASVFQLASIVRNPPPASTGPLINPYTGRIVA